MEGEGEEGGEEFKIPLYPESLFRVKDEGVYYVQKEPEEVSSLSKVEVADNLENIHNQIEVNASDMATHDVFDFIFILICRYPSLSRNCKPLLVNVLLDGLNGLLTMINSFKLEMDGGDDEDVRATKHTYCNALKMYVYCVQQLVFVTEKQMKSGETSKEEMADSELPLEKLFGVLVPLLEAEIHRLWNMAIIEQDFFGLFSKVCTSVLENPAYFRSGKNKHLKTYIAKVALSPPFFLTHSHYSLLLSHFPLLSGHRASLSPLRAVGRAGVAPGPSSVHVRAHHRRPIVDGGRVPCGVPRRRFDGGHSEGN